jgi:hypothetical protein
MSDTEQHLMDIRQELDRLKAALQSAPTSDERVYIRTCINACLRAYLSILNANLQAAVEWGR